MRDVLWSVYAVAVLAFTICFVAVIVYALDRLGDFLVHL